MKTARWSMHRVTATGRAPLTSLGIPFGLSGLAGTWTMATRTLSAPGAIGEVLWAIALTTWIAVIANYVVRSRNHGGTIAGDLRDPVQGPFASLAPTTGMLIGTHYAVALPVAGRLVVGAFIVLALLFGAWSIAQLARAERDVDKLHSGYLLPAVAAAFIAGQSAGTFGWTTLSVAAIGVGLLFWLLLGALILGRMAFRPALPPALLPTFAIFSAPPAVAGNAWFAFNGDRIDLLQEVLLGCFVLLILVQVMMLSAYWRLPFSLGFWAFTFTAASSGTYAINWLRLSEVPGHALWGYGALVLASTIIGSIAVRSVLFLVRAHASSRRAIAG